MTWPIALFPSCLKLRLLSSSDACDVFSGFAQELLGELLGMHGVDERRLARSFLLGVQRCCCCCCCALTGTSMTSSESYLFYECRMHGKIAEKGRFECVSHLCRYILKDFIKRTCQLVSVINATHILQCARAPVRLSGVDRGPHRGGALAWETAARRIAGRLSPAAGLRLATPTIMTVAVCTDSAAGCVANVAGTNGARA